jgi:hypothetical protein
MDAWKQSAYMTPAGTDLAGRTEWTLRRAGGAMLVTSATTSLAFLTNLVNNVVVLQVKPRAGPPHDLIARVLKRTRMVAFNTMVLQLFGLFMALMVMFDFIYTIVWFPAVVATYDRYLAHRPGACARCACRRQPVATVEQLVPAGREESVHKAVAAPRGGGSGAAVAPAPRWLERAFRDRVAGFVVDHRVPLAVACLATCVPAVGLAPPHDSDPQKLSLGPPRNIHYGYS